MQHLTSSCEFRRQRAIACIALGTFVLSVLVVAVSAYLRLLGAGLGCADWPGCYGSVLAGAPHAPWEGARLVHRIVATLALLGGFALVWRTLRPQPLQPAARYAALLLALMLFLSVVGVWSADPRLALVNFVNLIGGLGLVTFSWRVVITAMPRYTETQAVGGAVLRLGLAALTAAVLLGGLIGARYAAPACATVPDCQGLWWPGGDVWSALHPFVTLAGPAAAGDAGGVSLHLLHRYFAVAAALLLAAAAWRSWRLPQARPAAVMVLLFLGAEIALGVLTVASGFKLWLAVGHNVGAALLLAAAASLLRRAR
jgi:cytochrome c oxidase assembly protein subunit 15